MFEFAKNENQIRSGSKEQFGVSERNMGDFSFKPQSSFVIQKKCEECEEEPLQMSRGITPYTSLIQPKQDSGLPKDFKMQAESIFRQDFSDVSIHKDSTTANEINALAYTQGNQIHFAPGQYAPKSRKGQELLGHELTHVVQQREGRVHANTQAKGIPVNDEVELEREADEMGKKVVRQENVSTLVEADGEEKEDDNLLNGTPPLQLRLPKFSNLETVYKDATLAIPESVVQQMISQMLVRMEKDKLLLSTDSVPVIMSKIFPGPGVVVEAEFNKAVDVTNRNMIYETVLDTDRPVKAPDKKKLKTAIDRAVIICTEAVARPTSLKRIFGTKTAEAQDIYKRAGDKLKALGATDAAMDAGINVDYNRDDPALGLGGWANEALGIMHLQGEVAEVKNWRQATITLIHEGAHLAKSTVDDKGYYPGSSNKDAFAGASENRKITNAAHFEEFPRRWLNRSIYGAKTVFTPGTSVGGAPLTLEDETRDAVKEYFRKAWDIGVEVQWFLRDHRKEILAGNRAPFVSDLALAKELSKKMQLSIHRQAAGHETVTQLDLVLAESVPRVASKMGRESFGIPLTAVLNVAADKPAAMQQIIRDTIAANTTLLNDATKDKILLDWLVSKYPGFP